MPEFNVSDFLQSLEEVPEVESLEAPKKAVRKPHPLDVTFEVDESLDESPPAPKKGKGRPRKVVEPVDTDEEDASPPKPKRVQSDAQRENFKKALAKRQENIALRKAAKELEKQVKEAELETKKKEVERKIVKKAVCLKKKEILSQACLEDISDEEIPDEIVQKIVKKQRAKSAPKAKAVIPVEPVEPPAPKYNFV